MVNSAKKISQVILLVIFCIFAQANPGLSQNSGMTVKGDVNGDGVVNWFDAYLTLQLSTRHTPDHALLKDADANQDGKIGLVEAIYALQSEDQQMECGAYIAPGVWKEFDCYNLAAIGKTTNDDPFTPSWRLIGGYWQWGRKGPNPSQWHNTNTPNFAHGPTGPGVSSANSSSVSGWDQTYTTNGAWSDASKTANDPCPDGYRVPTKAQWDGVRANNTQGTVGTWSDSATNYSSARFFGNKLMLPAAGYRSNADGSLLSRGDQGIYWSSTEGASYYAWRLSFGSSFADTYDGSDRPYGGFSVRCEAEAPEISTLLDSVDAKISSMTATDLDERLQEIARYLATRTEFVASGIAASTGSVWGRTATGQTICFVDSMHKPTMKPKPAGFKADTGLSAASVPALFMAFADNRTEPPGGVYGHVATVYETKEFIDPTAFGISDKVSSYRGSPKYKTLFSDSLWQAFENASIERLAALHDVGVFYMNTVVGAFKQPDNSEIVAIMTSTDFTPSTEATYHSLLQDGLLVIMSSPPILPYETGEGPRLRRFGITSKFIREKIRLAPDALVYIDAGFGNHPDLKSAFAAVGADVYLSWEKMPCAVAEKKDLTAFFMFDHLMPSTSNYLMWPNSPSRPFDYQQVFTALGTKGLGWDMCGNSIPRNPNRDPHLVLTEGSGNLAFLAPSIRYLVVDETPPTPKPEHAILHIYGEFGTDPGAVNREAWLSAPSVNPLEIISWTPTEITCWIPSTPSPPDFGSRTAGRVYVHRRGIASNGVPLTEWFLPMRMYYRDPNTTFWGEANFTLHLRLDIHGWRDILNQPYPQSTPPESLFNGGATGYQTSAGRSSTGSWQCGGYFHDTGTHYTVLINGEEIATSVSDAYYEQSGSGSLIYQNEVTGMYATVVAYHDPVTLEKPDPTAKFRVNLRYRSGGKDVNFYIGHELYSQHFSSGSWTFNLEVDYAEMDDTGTVHTYPIKAGSYETLSWPKTLPAVVGTPMMDIDPH